jgi:hypothetical protein
MPDYMFQLESRFSPEQRAAMVRIQELAVEFESNLYLVGGAVRDVIWISRSRETRHASFVNWRRGEPS